MNIKKIAVSLVLLACILILAGCNEGEKAGKTKDIGKTAAELEKQKLLRQIEARYETPEPHYELGKIYQSQGRWPEADDQYSIALNFSPVHRRAQAARIKVLLNSGDKTKADTLNDIYMEQAAHSAAASLRLAVAFQQQQLDEHALKGYQQALRLAPNSATINKQIGFYYLSKNDKDRAKDYLTRSYQLGWNQPDVAGELGRLGVAIGKPARKDQSAKNLEKIVDSADKKK